MISIFKPKKLKDFDPKGLNIYTYNAGFKNDVQHGNAIETYKDGTVIKLSYKYGLRDGKYYERGNFIDAYESCFG